VGSGGIGPDGKTSRVRYRATVATTSATPDENAITAALEPTPATALLYPHPCNLSATRVGQGTMARLMAIVDLPSAGMESDDDRPLVAGDADERG